MGRIKYIERPDRQVWSQPYDLRNVSFYGFEIAANIEKLQAICDRFLTRPSGGALRYVALAPCVLLYFADLRKSRSLSHEHEDCGWLRELEFGIWIPVARVRTVAGISKVEGLAVLPYYTLVDSCRAMSNAREVYGMYKELAEVEVPSDPRGIFRVRTLQFDGPGPEVLGQHAQLLELAQITGSDGAGDAAEGLIEGAANSLRFLAEGVGNLLARGVVPGLSTFAKTWDELVRGEPPFVFLKQYRHAGAPERAAYQAIVEARFRIQDVRGAGLLPGEYELNVKTSFGHPMVEELGLDQDTFSGLRGFRMSMDFRFDEGHVIWEAR